MPIIYRLDKGAPLTHAELDGNFEHLEAGPYAFGYENWNATNGAQALSGRTKIQNNGLGSFTELTHKIPGRGDIWNPATGQFDFVNAGLVAGDTVTFRLSGVLTTTGANHTVSIGMQFAISGFSYDLTFSEINYRYAGDHAINEELSIYIGDDNTRTNPAELWIESEDNTDTFNYYSHFVKYQLFRPVYL